jgi:hypothetical protein
VIGVQRVLHMAFVRAAADSVPAATSLIGPMRVTENRISSNTPGSPHDSFNPAAQLQNNNADEVIRLHQIR